MNISPNDKVNGFLADIQFTSHKNLDRVILIRELFLKAKKNLNEDIKYGGLVFSISKELIAGVFSYKNHISIEFGNGVDFIDNDSILEGSGKQRRHIKIFKDSDIGDKKCDYYISQAITIATKNK